MATVRQRNHSDGQGSGEAQAWFGQAEVHRGAFDVAAAIEVVNQTLERRRAALALLGLA
jgi:hypothetical protein